MTSSRRLHCCFFLVTALIIPILAAAQATTPSSQTSQEPAPQAPDAAQDQAQKPSLLTPLPRKKESEPYHTVTDRQRLRWFLSNTVGPPHLFGAGSISAAFGTALDRPKEYGPGWRGFGDRFGMRLTGTSTGNAMEASIGKLWGEDPRYFAIPNEALKERIRNVVMQSFRARHRGGDYEPAWARYIAMSGNNFLSNTWRVHSEANTHDAVIRTGEGFLGRMASNAYEEFWPDVKKRISRRKR